VRVHNVMWSLAFSDYRCGAGVAFTPVAPPSRQQSRVIERQRSSDNVIANNTIRMVTAACLSLFIAVFKYIILQVGFFVAFKQ